MSKSVVIIGDCSFQRNNLNKILRNNNFDVSPIIQKPYAASELTIVLKEL